MAPTEKAGEAARSENAGDVPEAEGEKAGLNPGSTPPRWWRGLKPPPGLQQKGPGFIVCL